MERRATANILFLALLLSLLLPTVGASGWYCEGRPCGVSFWLCCCLSPDDFRDANCPQENHLEELSASEAEESLLCGNGCNCQIILTADAPARAESSPAFALSVVAILLAASESPAPLLATTALVPGETRGPPIAPVSRLPLGLRAPPVA